MKVTHRIPTTQYGYVEVEISYDPSWNKDAECRAQMREDHDALIAAFAEKPQNTLSDKEFTDIIYGCLHNTKELTADRWESMNAAQQTMLKCLKNAMSRKKIVDEYKDAKINIQVD